MLPPPPARRPGLFVKTFGCQMNEYDSQKVKALLSTSHDLVEDVRDASLVFVNTCSVREKGEHKLFSLLGTLRELKQEKPELIIGVGGCVAQQEGEDIVRRNSSVDFVVGTHNLSLIPALAKRAQHTGEAQIAVDYRDEWEDLPEAASALEAGTSPGELGSVRALVAIQRGCNKLCAYCVVPTTRGPEVSRSMAEIEREVRLKARLGSKEVLLLGQTVNSYGRDLTPRSSFATLIRRIADIPGIERIRFTSPHPAEVRPDFLDLYSTVPQLCPHIHLPLQSGSDRVLKLMNRNYRTSRYLEIVDGLRERCDGLAVTTDFIVGFPTETDDDFSQTIAMMERVRYTSSYIFKYSRRPNTVALTAFAPEDEVPAAIAQERLVAVQSLQERLSMAHHTGLVGRTLDVLIESAVPGIAGRHRGRSPDNTLVDVLEAPQLRPGQTVAVKVLHGAPHGVRAMLLPQKEALEVAT